MQLSLAKKLFETGYRFYRAPQYGHKGEQVVKLERVLYLVPTLEELIRAVLPEDKFPFRLRLKKGTWRADFDDDFYTEATNPVDAVAKLWVLLHK